MPLNLLLNRKAIVKFGLNVFSRAGEISNESKSNEKRKENNVRFSLQLQSFVIVERRTRTEISSFISSLWKWSENEISISSTSRRIIDGSSRITSWSNEKVKCKWTNICISRLSCRFIDVNIIFFDRKASLKMIPKKFERSKKFKVFVEVGCIDNDGNESSKNIFGEKWNKNENFTFSFLITDRHMLN